MQNIEKTSSNLTNKSIPPKHLWQWSALAWLSIADVILAFLVMIFIAKLAYESFRAGEMGTMVGILTLASLPLPITWFIIKIIISTGIFKGRRWALVLGLIFTGIGAIIGISSIMLGFFVFTIIIGFHLLMLYLEITCLREF